MRYPLLHHHHALINTIQPHETDIDSKLTPCSLYAFTTSGHILYTNFFDDFTFCLRSRCSCSRLDDSRSHRHHDKLCTNGFYRPFISFTFINFYLTSFLRFYLALTSLERFAFLFSLLSVSCIVTRSPGISCAVGEKSIATNIYILKLPCSSIEYMVETVSFDSPA